MRSYYAHLQNTALSPSTLMAKPVLRASAIFPAFQRKGITTRLLFLGYWFLKRNISSLTQVVNLREKEGRLVWRSVVSVNVAKAYRVELSELLQQAGRGPLEEFEGSIEIEFFSIQNLVFPFPAVVVNYYGPHFTTVVHTTQRVYNNFEDMEANSETKVPEAGFNIYATDNCEPCITLINGPEKCPNSYLYVECFNRKGRVLQDNIFLGELRGYSMHKIHLTEYLPLKEFLDNQVGTVRVAFDLRWVFPRLLVGNWQRDPSALTVTHTYYDCTRACSPSDYWYASNKEWHTAALMVPLCAEGLYQTKFYFYPIYSPSSFYVDLEIYDSRGRLLDIIKEALHIRSPSTEFEIIDAAAHVKRLGWEKTSPLGARLIARPDPGTNLPARIKLALDIGSASHLPCNICTNLQPFNPSWEGKTHTFKWAPLLTDAANPEVWIVNSSPKVDWTHTAEVNLHFYREKDEAVLERSCHLLPHGFIVIRPKEDPELEEFLQGKVGWVTVSSSNPYTTTYYFSRPQHSIVGGDHGF